MTPLAPTGGLIPLSDDSIGSCADGMCRMPVATLPPKQIERPHPDVVADAEMTSPPVADDVDAERSDALSRPE
jgi:hypothetical protein